jgi:hypothetical protein
VKRWLIDRRESLLLALILTAGAALRLYGLNWDGGHWLHPDERQVYFVALGLAWPSSLSQALSPDSPLNPQFFAYGSLPFYVLKSFSVVLSLLLPVLRDSDNLHLAGRPLAVLFDVGTIYLTYRLARTLLPRPTKGQLNAGALFAAGLVALAVVHLQLAHFYTVDPLLTFFVMLTLFLAAVTAEDGGRWTRAALGIAYGSALATKISAAPLLFPILFAYYQRARKRVPSHKSRTERFVDLLPPLALTIVLAILTFVAIQPYALIDWPTFLDHTIRESQIASGSLDVPYTRQYAGTLPYLYSMWQTALWGLALPVGLVAWLSLAASLVRWLRRGTKADALLLAWALPYLAITGLLYTRYLRYMQPLVPTLCILIALLSADIKRASSQQKLVVNAGQGLLILVSAFYALAFLTIYALPHSWLTASEWMYTQAPQASTLVVEEWDAALPLPLTVDGQPRRIEEFDVRTLPLYGEPDDEAKWQDIAADLAASDYVILASRRLYGSIPRSPDRYPLATRYYDRLFAGDLGFELAGEFSRGPSWLNPRIEPLPDPVPSWLQPDESFVVYDHPRTLVYGNADRLNATEIADRLAAP